jgi:hypothetical protein
MKHKKLIVIALSVAAALTMLVAAFAQSAGATYTLLATVPLPADSAGKLLTSWDITWVDPGTGRFFITNRTTTKGGGRIDVVDTQTNKFLYSVPSTKGEIGFTGTTPATTPGCTISGPNGVVAVPYLNQLYVGDGNATVKVVDLAARAVVAVIPTGGNCRADELGYDPLDHIIMIASPDDRPPFVTFISTDSQTILGQYTYTGRMGGLEQPVYSALTQKFYITVPGIGVGGTGSVDVFDPITMKLENSYAIGCSPAGLVLTPAQTLWTSCGAALTVNGSQVATITGQGDQIWYNSADNRVYFTTNVVDAATNQVIGTLPGVSPGRVNPAADSSNGHVFAPVSQKGINVYSSGR